MIGTALGAVGLVLSVLSALVALTSEGAPHAVLTALVGSATVAILVGVGLCEMAGPDDHDAGNTADTADRGPDAAAESTGCVESVTGGQTAVSTRTDAGPD